MGAQHLMHRLPRVSVEVTRQHHPGCTRLDALHPAADGLGQVRGEVVWWRQARRVKGTAQRLRKLARRVWRSWVVVRGLKGEGRRA
jgi:hypothetical protein